MFLRAQLCAAKPMTGSATLRARLHYYMRHFRSLYYGMYRMSGLMRIEYIRAYVR